MTRIEVAVLASIVNGETNNEAEMPLIAGVYLNRLKSGWPLQADPTVAFCFDYSLGRILNKHLSVDSPYNTYKHTGLPPGPICVPTKAALDAVLNPDFGGERGGEICFSALLWSSTALMSSPAPFPSITAMLKHSVVS